MGFKEQHSEMKQELDRFMKLVSDFRERYAVLMKKTILDDQELEELGEIEHFLIDAVSRLSDFNSILEQDVFGHSLQLYNDLKIQASKGDLQAERKLNRLKDSFHKSLLSGGVVHWN